jgi:histidinol-phosphate aminotransferase
MQTSFSRRSFVRTLGVGGIGAFTLPAIVARGHEALLAQGEKPGRGPLVAASRESTAAEPIIINSNENPNGPGPAALAAMSRGFSTVSRYPDSPEDDVRDAVARRHGIASENVLMGCGSTEILRMAVDAFCSPARGLVTPAPTFEWPEERARQAGFPVTSIPVDGALLVDLRRMAEAAPGSGLIYVCNPNNPTATAHSARAMKDFVASVRKASPDTTILIDEAYFEYVDASTCSSALPIAMDDTHVVVAKTFSKIFGMAGLRLGYAVGAADTLRTMERHKIPSGVNLLAAVGAAASVGDLDHLEHERSLNRAAKDYTRRYFESAGFKVVPSETNFIMVDIRRDSGAFRDACRARGVRIGRPFPPLTTHTRISIGTLDEMHRAVEVFREVLA